MEKLGSRVDPHSGRAGAFVRRRDHPSRKGDGARGIQRRQAGGRLQTDVRRPTSLFAIYFLIQSI